MMAGDETCQLPNARVMCRSRRLIGSCWLACGLQGGYRGHTKRPFLNVELIAFPRVDHPPRAIVTDVTDYGPWAGVVGRDVLEQDALICYNTYLKY